ncbi:MAG: MoaD/ThiS family protein [Bacteroidota bacterium]
MITVLFFGSLTDVTTVHELQVDAISDTEQLISFLNGKYPALQTAKYFISVNQQMVQEKITIQRDDIVALMPPFSGG